LFSPKASSHFKHVIGNYAIGPSGFHKNGLLCAAAASQTEKSDPRPWLEKGDGI
jgi:hypothetical protein